MMVMTTAMAAGPKSSFLLMFAAVIHILRPAIGVGTQGRLRLRSLGPHLGTAEPQWPRTRSSGPTGLRVTLILMRLPCGSSLGP